MPRTWCSLNSWSQQVLKQDVGRSIKAGSPSDSQRLGHPSRPCLGTTAGKTSVRLCFSRIFPSSGRVPTLLPLTGLFAGFGQTNGPHSFKLSINTFRQIFFWEQTYLPQEGSGFRWKLGEGMIATQKSKGIWEAEENNLTLEVSLFYLQR